MLFGFSVLQLGTWAAFLLVALYIYRARKLGARLSTWSFILLAVLAAFGIAGFLGWVQFQSDSIMTDIQSLWELLAGLADWLIKEVQ